MATIHFSPFTCCFRWFLGVHSRFFSQRERRTHTQSLLCSLFSIEIHIHIFSPITQIVDTKVVVLRQLHWLKNPRKQNIQCHLPKNEPVGLSQSCVLQEGVEHQILTSRVASGHPIGSQLLFSFIVPSLLWLYLFHLLLFCYIDSCLCFFLVFTFSLSSS